MIKLFKILSLGIIIVFLNSCGGVPGTGGKNYSELKLEIPENETIIFVGRKNRGYGSLATVKILLNGEDIGNLGIGEFLKRNISPGSHKVYAKQGSKMQWGTGEDSIAFVAQKGKAYFFIADFEKKLLGGSWNIIETTLNGFEGSIY